VLTLTRCYYLRDAICRLNLVFRCNLLPRDTSSTSLRHHRAEIEGDHEEYSVDYISGVKIDNWPRGKSPYLQFLTQLVSFDIPEWMILEQVDDCEQLSIFLGSESGIFSLRDMITLIFPLDIQ